MAHARRLHDVPKDNNCQFHALLHALQNQIDPPRATNYNATSLRQAVVDILDNDNLQDRSWLAATHETDRAPPVLNLRASLAAEAARSDREW